ncbi:hypothetical protein Hanom_Chr10g00952781 [Helianthus anomalus]
MRELPYRNTFQSSQRSHFRKDVAELRGYSTKLFFRRKTFVGFFCLGRPFHGLLVVS